MLECYTTLGALARETTTVRLGALVTGNTYRNPALLAKIITALDVVSNGRAQLGIGAGWFEFEHDSLGFEFGTFTDRFEKLEEALQIILPMLRDERPTLDGKHYTVKDAINQPPPLVAHPGDDRWQRREEDAAAWSRSTPTSRTSPAPSDEVPRKLDVLAAHCERLGRDRSEITVSQAPQRRASPRRTTRRTTTIGALPRRPAGSTSRRWTRTSATRSWRMVIWGDADEVGEQLDHGARARASTASPARCPPTATCRTGSSSSAQSRRRHWVSDVTRARRFPRPRPSRRGRRRVVRVVLLQLLRPRCRRRLLHAGRHPPERGNDRRRARGVASRRRHRPSAPSA